jgi:S-adenosylmethionine hydrolase
MRMAVAPCIALLTDFGTTDPFVGIMKGVLAAIAPGVPLIDLTHGIPASDVQRAAITLWQAHTYFPTGTIFLSVVDPGVGTARRALCVSSSGYTFFGPDNGLFSFCLAPGFAAWELVNPAYALPEASATFHGRDRFAPAAAHAARGVPLAAFGPAVEELVRLPSPVLSRSASGHLLGEVLHADHFGNLLTSLGCFRFDGEQSVLDPWLPGVAGAVYSPSQTWLQLPGGHRLAWVRTFADIPPADCAVLVGSSGLLEIVANRRPAAQLLNLSSGSQIQLVALP